MEIMRSLNPYRERGPIKEPERFYGRTKELRIIASTLQNKQCCALVGERRIGKSSVLKYISHPDVCAQYGFPIEKYLFIDVGFQGKLDLTPEDFWRLLIMRARRKISDLDLKSLFDELCSQDKIQFFDIEDLMYELDEKDVTLICLLDEFDHCSKSEKLDYNFFGGLRHLTSEHNIAYVTASRISLFDLQYSSDVKDSPFFNIVREVQLGHFTHDEALQLIHKPVQKATDDFVLPQETSVTFDSEDEKFILEIAGYHPFFLQLACCHLYDTYEMGGEKTEAEFYTSARQAFMREATPHFRYYWEESSDIEKQLMAELSTSEITKAKYSPLLGKLMERSLISQTTQHSYQLFSTAFGEYLKNNVISPDGNILASSIPSEYMPEAIVIVDIQSSVELGSRYGATFLGEICGKLHEVVSESADQHHYRHIGDQGDVFLITFATIPDAIAVCRDILEQITRYRREIPLEQRFYLRFCLNFGEIYVGPKNRYGGPINLAARLEATNPDDLIEDDEGIKREDFPRGDYILATENVHKTIRDMLGVTSKFLGFIEPRGITGRHRIYQVLL